MAEELDPLRQRLIIDARGALVSIRNVRAKFGDLGDFVGRHFKRLAVAGIAAVTAALAGAVRQAIVFGKGMAEVSTLVDTASVSMGSLNRQILELGRRTPVALGDLTKGLYQVISAGVPAGEAIKFLETASKAAVGGVTDTKTAVDGLTTAVNAWETGADSAAQVSDKFFTAVKLGKTTFGELSAKIGTVAPIAAQANVSLEEVLSAASALTLTGLDTARAMDYLRGVIAKIIRPTTQAQEVAKQYGIELGAQALASKGLTGFLEDLTNKIGGNTQAQAELFEDVEALTAVLGLAGSQADDYARILGEMKRSTGAADEATRKMNREVSNQWELLKNKMNVAMTELGTAILPVVNEGLGSLVDWMERMRSPGDAAVSILERMGANAKIAASEVSRIADIQRLNRINTTLARGLPVGSVTGIQKPKAIPTFDPVMSVIMGSLNRPAVSTQDVQPFATDDQALAQKAENLMLAESLGGRIIELTLQAAEEQRRLTEAEQEQIDALYEQLDLLTLYNRQIDNYREALAERENIEKRIAKGPNFLGVEPLSAHGASPSKDASASPTSTADPAARVAALEQLRALRHELELLAAPNEELRELLAQRQRLQERLNELNAIAADLGPSAVQKEIRAFEDLLKAVNSTIEAKQKDPVFDVGKVAGREARTPTSMDAIAERAHEWRTETEATERSTLKIRTLSFKVVNAMEQIAKKMGINLEETEDYRHGLLEALKAAEAIGRALREIGAPKELIALVDGVSGLSGSIGTLVNASSPWAAISAGAGVIGAIGGLVGALGANDEEQRRLREALEKSRRAMENYAEALTREATIGGGLTAEDRDFAKNAYLKLLGVGVSGGILSDEQAQKLLTELVDRGILPESILQDFKNWMEQGTGTLFDFLRDFNVDDILFTTFTRTGQSGDSLAGAFNSADLAGVLGGDQDKFNAFIEHLMKQDIGDPLRALLQGAVGLDLSTPEGQAELRRIIEAIVTALMSGSTQFLGGDLTSEDLKDIAEFFKTYYSPGDGSGEGTSNSVSFNRQVTEIQFNEWIALAETSEQHLRDIRDDIRNGKAFGGSRTVTVGDVHIQAGGITDVRELGVQIREQIEYQIRRAERF